MRKAKDMPKVGNRVYVLEQGTRNYARRGTVVGYTPGTKQGRAYTVQFGKQTRKIRACDCWKPSQIQWS